MYDLNRYSTLRSVNVTGVIYDRIGKIDVVQEYYSTNTNPLEVKYNFTLDPTAVMTKVSLKINNETFVGVIQEKKEARVTYVKKIEEKKLTLLVEKNNDIFSIQCGNIKPNTEITISYSYITLLENINKSFMYVLPTNIAPRYIPSGVTHNPSNYISYNSSVEYNFNLDFEIKSNNKINKVECKGDAVITKLSDYKYNVKCSRNPSDGDCVIKFNTDILPTVYKNHNEYYLNFFSDDLDAIKTNGKYTIIVDRSGSMSGKKMADARKALELFVHSLPEESLFNIVSFGSNYSTLWKEHKMYTEENKNDAIQHIKSMNADMGGTELFSCIRYILGENESKTTWTTLENTDTKVNLDTKVKDELEHNIIILTDGQVEGSISLFLKQKKNIKVFTLGIGDDANRNILTEIANSSYGVCRMIGDSAKLEESVIELLGFCFSEYCKNITINDEILAEYAYPNKCVALFGKTSKYISCVKFDYNGQKVVLPINAGEIFSENNSNDFVSQFYYNNQIEKKLVKNYVELSKEYSILTQYTSFILCKEDEIVESSKPLVTEQIEHVELGELSRQRAVLRHDDILEDQSAILDGGIDDQCAEIEDQGEVLRNVSIKSASRNWYHSRSQEKCFGDLEERSDSLRDTNSRMFYRSSSKSLRRRNSIIDTMKEKIGGMIDYFKGNGTRNSTASSSSPSSSPSSSQSPTPTPSPVKKELLDYKLTNGSFKYSEDILSLNELNVTKEEFNKYVLNNNISEDICINIIIYNKIKDIKKYEIIVRFLQNWLSKNYKNYLSIKID